MADSNDVIIPKHIEAYSQLRVEWYSAPEDWSAVTIQSATDAQTISQLPTKAQTFDAFPTLSQLTGGVELKSDGDSDVASMSWNKDTESPAGVMSFMLFPRKNYEQLINPEDVFLVYGKSDKYTPERFIAMISIDDVRESRNVDGSGATIKRISVVGRDLGKVLMETPVIYDSAFGMTTQLEAFTQFTKAFAVSQPIGGPSVVVQSLLAIFFSLDQNFVTRSIGATLDATTIPNSTLTTLVPMRPFLFPNSTVRLSSFLDLSSFVQKPMVGALSAVQPALAQNAANLWALGEQYANKAFNEFFVDTRDLVDGYADSHNRNGYYAQQFLNQFGDNGGDQNAALKVIAATSSLVNSDTVSIEQTSTATVDSVIALVHRQRPYDTYSFFALPNSVVFETEVFSNDTGRSSRDVRNMFRVRLPGRVEGIIQDANFGVVVNQDSINKHGLRMLEVESIYIQTNSSSPKAKLLNGYSPAFQFYMSLLTAWNAYNEFLHSGSMVMRFRPDIRIGTRLTFIKTVGPDIFVQDFYVERVNHNYSAKQGASRTTLDLSRGISRQGVAVVPNRESHLFWTDKGASLSPDPYTIVQSRDLFALKTNGKLPDPTTLAPTFTND